MTLREKWLCGLKDSVSEENYNLLNKASFILENDIFPDDSENLPWSPYRGISPNPKGFPGIWNWDAAFHAMTVSRWDPELAREQLKIMWLFQREDGLMPDVIFTSGKIEDKYGKPPVWPWAAVEIDRRDKNDNFLREAYGRFKLNEEFWRKNRRDESTGLYFYSTDDAECFDKKTKWESGWDNSVRWDSGIHGIYPIDLNCFMVMFFRALTYMAKRIAPSEESAWLGRAAKMSELVERHFWDSKAQCYFDCRRGSLECTDVLTPASFMPLFIGTASQERAEKMARTAGDKNKLYPSMPTVAFDNPGYSDEPGAYWRGPVWLNVAYFAAKGLKDYGFDGVADGIRDTILSFVRRDSSIHENYNAKTGEPLCNADFGWSSAFTIEFILNF